MLNVRALALVLVGALVGQGCIAAVTAANPRSTTWQSLGYGGAVLTDVVVTVAYDDASLPFQPVWVAGVLVADVLLAVAVDRVRHRRD